MFEKKRENFLHSCCRINSISNFLEIKSILSYSHSMNKSNFNFMREKSKFIYFSRNSSNNNKSIQCLCLSYLSLSPLSPNSLSILNCVPIFLILFETTNKCQISNFHYLNIYPENKKATNAFEISFLNLSICLHYICRLYKNVHARIQ